MLFMISYEVTPEHRDTVQDRFRSVGEAIPPGVELLGHWESVTQLEGWGVAEAADAQALARMFHGWTDLNVNHITPVLDAEGIRKSLSS